MPQTVPPEYVGRFSVKRKSSSGIPQRSEAPNSTLKDVPTFGATHGPQRDQSASSGSAAPVSYSTISSRQRTPVPITKYDRHEAGTPNVEQLEVEEERFQAESELLEAYQSLDASSSGKEMVHALSPEHTPMALQPSAHSANIIYSVLRSSFNDQFQYNQNHVVPTAQAIVAEMTAPHGPDPAVFIIAVIQMMKRTAIDLPQCIDFLLSTFAEASNLIPSEIVTEYGKGTAAGTNRLRAWLREESKRHADEPNRQETSTNQMRIGSKTNFREAHIPTVEEVLSEIATRKRVHASSVITAAMHGRAFALGILQMEEKRHIGNLIRAGLSRGKGRRKKTRVISACIMLRACGQTVVDGSLEAAAAEETRRIELRGALEEIIITQDEELGDGGFAIKAHAGVRGVFDWPSDGCAYRMH